MFYDLDKNVNMKLLQQLYEQQKNNHLNNPEQGLGDIEEEKNELVDISPEGSKKKTQKQQGKEFYMNESGAAIENLDSDDLDLPDLNLK